MQHTTVDVTPYEVNMGASVYEFSNHIQECNNNFRENIFKKLHTIKLKDTEELNKKIEELKIQEAQELSHLNKNYNDIESKCKKLERKVSVSTSSTIGYSHQILLTYVFIIERELCEGHRELDWPVAQKETLQSLV